MTDPQPHKTTLPPAVMVYGLHDARLALAPSRPVTLLSPPGAALSWGCLWWKSLLAACKQDRPALLDCAAAPGRAAEALAIGLSGVVLAPCPAWDEIAALAAQRSAILLSALPPFLDLRLKDSERRLISWLGG
jgi:hypothetical protein